MELITADVVKNVNAKGFVPDEFRNDVFKKLRMKYDNRTCFECPTRNPTWISLTYGIYLCLECSGEHRRKGVHLSFVRSAELDSFTPEQLVQMAVGGNARAWTYFKAQGMGKTSESGRPVDYSSGAAVRFKQQIEKETKDALAKLGAGKAAAPAAAATSLPEADPVDLAAEFAGAPSPTALQASKSAPASVPSSAAAPKAAPRPAEAPATVVVRRTEPVKPAAAPAPAAAAPAPAANRPSFASKQVAKEIEFDFDFDELEKEASKPSPAPPAPAPKPASPVAAPAPAPTPVPSQPAKEAASGANKFAKNKAISSDDFFGELEAESASARLDREQRYNKFSSAGAISSASFFGDGEPEELGRKNSGEGGDWKAGLSKGAELLTTYLNKVRD